LILNSKNSCYLIRNRLIISIKALGVIICFNIGLRRLSGLNLSQFVGIRLCKKYVGICTCNLQRYWIMDYKNL